MDSRISQSLMLLSTGMTSFTGIILILVLLLVLKRFVTSPIDSDASFLNDGTLECFRINPLCFTANI